jgi:tetratricopeptide (TPR) repeat protein
VLVSIDRAKALKSAQKYLAKGQIDRAIVEYEKMVGADPDDARLLLKLGDLYTRKGDNKGASQTYRKVAQQYAKQGFFLKAVAVYKQILKLEPGDLTALESLGEMYEMLSLVSDALATYEQVADAYTDQGKPDKALKALGKVAELESENVAAWIRYAEALSKTNQIDAAAEAFRKGADLLERQGRIDDYIKVTERLLFHSHEDLDRARKLAAIYIERGQAKTALTHLQPCFKADPTETATLGLLARAFRALGQSQKAASVYKEMARIHAEAGRLTPEAEALRALLEIEPNDNDARQRLALLPDAGGVTDESGQVVLDEELDEVVIVEDGPGSGSLRSVAVPLDMEDREAQIKRLMAECEVFLRYGLRDKVVAQLNRVLDLDPHHIEAREKLKETHLKRGEIQSAVTQLLLLSETVAGSDPGRAGAYLEQAATLSPQNEAVVERLRELRQAHEDAVAAGGASDEHDADDDEVIVVPDDDEADFSDLRSSPPIKVGPREVSLATELEGGDEPELLFEEGEEEEEPEEEEPEQEDVAESAAELVMSEAPADQADDEELDDELSEMLEEAGFYLQQGLLDEAREVLVEASLTHPNHPAVRAKLRELDGESADAPPEPVEDKSFAMAQKLADEAGGAVQGPVEVATVLEQFKQGIKRQVDKSDTATHYDLGIAYVEMGLHAEAIEAFRLCLDKPEKQCTAHTMIGLSYVAKGDMGSGIEHFKQALASPLRTADEELSLWFEIGSANELLGKATDALVWYEKVEERDPTFRDVTTRIERLGFKKSAQQEGDEFDAMFDNMILKE